MSPISRTTGALLHGCNAHPSTRGVDEGWHWDKCLGLEEVEQGFQRLPRREHCDILMARGGGAASLNLAGLRGIVGCTTLLRLQFCSNEFENMNILERG